MESTQKTNRLPYFEVRKTVNSAFYFLLKNHTGEVLMSSEMFFRIENVLEKIDIVKNCMNGKIIMHKSTQQ